MMADGNELPAVTLSVIFGYLSFSLCPGDERNVEKAGTNDAEEKYIAFM